MEPRSVSLTVHGTPQPKGSARGFVLKKKGQKPRAIVTSANPNLRAWEDSIRYAAQDVADEFFDGAVALHVAFYIQRPKSISEKKRPYMTTRPDLSKCIRGVEDALTGILWKDDAQVVTITASKAYAGVREPSRAVITITEIPLLTSPPRSTGSLDLAGHEPAGARA